MGFKTALWVPGLGVRWGEVAADVDTAEEMLALADKVDLIRDRSG